MHTPLGVRYGPERPLAVSVITVLTFIVGLIYALLIVLDILTSHEPGTVIQRATSTVPDVGPLPIHSVDLLAGEGPILVAILQLVGVPASFFVAHGLWKLKE